MAIAAIDRFDIFLVRKIGAAQILMAGDTFQLAVNGFFQYGMIDVKRNLLAVLLRAEAFVPMAGEAVVCGLGQ
jgi:hypothetical protein